MQIRTDRVNEFDPKDFPLARTDDIVIVKDEAGYHVITKYIGGNWGSYMNDILEATHEGEPINIAIEREDEYKSEGVRAVKLRPGVNKLVVASEIHSIEYPESEKLVITCHVPCEKDEPFLIHTERHETKTNYPFGT